MPAATPGTCPDTGRSGLPAPWRRALARGRGKGPDHIGPNPGEQLPVVRGAEVPDLEARERGSAGAGEERNRNVNESAASAMQARGKDMESNTNLRAGTPIPVGKEARRGEASALCALALGVVLLASAAATARAQTVVTLVSNANQPQGTVTSHVVSTLPQAQGFQVPGPWEFTARAGFILKEVQIQFHEANKATDADVEIWTASGNEPGAFLAQLATVGTISDTGASLHTFNSTNGVRLDAGGTYFVVVKPMGLAVPRLSLTPSDTEDPPSVQLLSTVGWARAWSIGDTRLTESAARWEEHESVLRIAIRGHERAYDDDEARLSDLTVTDDDDNEYVLDPPFSPGKKRLYVRVPNEVDALTITPTPHEPAAAWIKYMDEAWRSIAEPDRFFNPYRLELDEGQNAISVGVRSRGGYYYRDYTLHIERERPGGNRPQLVNARLDGAREQIRIDMNLALGGTPPASAFSVSAPGWSGTIDGVAGGAGRYPRTVFLVLSTPVTGAREAEVTYTDPTPSDDAEALQSAERGRCGELHRHRANAQERIENGPHKPQWQDFEIWQRRHQENVDEGRVPAADRRQVGRSVEQAVATKSDTDAYRLEWSPDGLDWRHLSTKVRKGGWIGNSHAHKQVCDGQRYYYRVRAKRDGVFGPWSNIKSAVAIGTHAEAASGRGRVCTHRGRGRARDRSRVSDTTEGRQLPAARQVPGGGSVVREHAGRSGPGGRDRGVLRLRQRARAWERSSRRRSTSTGRSTEWRQSEAVGRFEPGDAAKRRVRSRQGDGCRRSTLFYSGASASTSREKSRSTASKDRRSTGQKATTWG